MLPTSRLGSGSLGALARFALLALVPVVALGAVLAHELNVDVQQRYLDSARTSATLIAQVGIQPLLSPQMISGGMTPAEIQQVNQQLQGAAVSSDVERIKLWNRSGKIVYSDNQSLIGAVVPIDDDLANALAGTPSASITNGKSAENAGDNLSGDYIQVYVPLVFTGSSTPSGAFELYLPYAPVQAAVDHESQQLYAVLAIGLTLFYASMFPVVLIADRWRRRLKGQAEAAALANLAVLERLNRLKTEFISRISHQFRTSLVGIQGFSELLRDSGSLDIAEVREFANDIYNDAEKLGKAFDEMLELDRPEAGHMVLEVSRVNLNELVGRAAQSIRNEHPERRIAAYLDPGAGVVSCDPEKIANVVTILLGNAIKYSPMESEVSVVSEVRDDQVTLTVSDHGPGMPADFDVRLFMRDQDRPEASANGTGVQGGRGLGLLMARQIVEMHGGRIWFDSTGQGSQFHFTLPLETRLRRELAAVRAR
ncbi:MAG TPA: HAMP domain-containing sensor histidine kinase [Candidatus Dormibacteraeota bacterium]|nr:HAMP domain-containing sensor histidine kinase [Candidatus Dormibacteraeota bacterium]